MIFNPGGYCIKFRSENSFLNGVKFLFSKGFVFTNERIKTIDDMRARYNCVNEWRYVYVLHRQGDVCKMVINTSSYFEKCWNMDLPVETISLRKFVKEILPHI